MVLLITYEQIKLESCACGQIKALKERNWRLYPVDSGDLSETEEMWQTLTVMVVAFFALFYQICVIKVVVFNYG